MGTFDHVGTGRIVAYKDGIAVGLPPGLVEDGGFEGKEREAVQRRVLGDAPSRKLILSGWIIYVVVPLIAHLQREIAPPVKRIGDRVVELSDGRSRHAQREDQDKT